MSPEPPESSELPDWEPEADPGQPSGAAEPVEPGLDDSPVSPEVVTEAAPETPETDPTLVAATSDRPTVTPETPAEPPTPVSPAPGSPSGGFDFQEFWQETKPLLKEQTVRALRGTIQLLERLIAWIEAEPIAPDAAVETVSEPSWVDTTIARIQPTLTTARETVQTGWQRFQTWWNPILGQIRGFLPESLNQQLSDPALTGILSGVLVLVVWVTGSLVFSPAKPPTEVATAPPVADIKDLPDKPTNQPVPPDLTTPVPLPAPVVTPTPVVKKPAPPLKLSPEQKLIASIQDQVAEVSKQYAEGLIQSVQANFRSSRLTVTVSQSWYGLTRSQQDKLATGLLKRAQLLDFSKLELVDPEEQLLARSPVVGSEMVILKRSQESPEVG